MLRNIFGAVAVTCLTGMAHASTLDSTITIYEVTGTWSVIEVTDDTDVTGEGTSELYWGTEWYEGEGTSGHVFEPIDTEEPVTYEVGEVFVIGTYTHDNNVIHQGEMVEVARLDLSITAEFDDNGQEEFDIYYDFYLNETPNLDDPCADGADNGDGNNSNGCADNVQLLNNETSVELFTYDGLTYTLEFLGFQGETDDIWTVEEEETSIDLIARFTVMDTRGDPLPPIPLPAGVWALLTALGGFGVMRRFRRS